MDIASLFLILVTVFGAIVLIVLIEIGLQIEDLTKAVREVARITVETSTTKGE